MNIELEFPKLRVVGNPLCSIIALIASKYTPIKYRDNGVAGRACIQETNGFSPSKCQRPKPIRGSVVNDRQDTVGR